MAPLSTRLIVLVSIAVVAPLAAWAGKPEDEHALHLLVPDAAATHVAARDGDWSAPSTWMGGAVPGAGARVLVPTGLTVRYDRDETTPIGWLRVDGTLDVAVDRDTRLALDTLVVNHTGRLQVGTADRPVAADRRAEIEFVDSGPITRATDDKKFGRGLISMGAVRIHGARVLPFTTSSDAIVAGATTVTLAQAPLGWRTGDRVLVAGTRVPQRVWNGMALVWIGSQDEVRTLTAVSGSTLTLDAPLTYAHAAATAGGPRPQVALLRRNVTFSTRGGTSVEVQRRGHVMFMHTADEQIEWAAFRDLGRTDKSRWTDDAGTDPVRTRFPDRATAVDPSSWDADTVEGANPRGRYSLHIHRAGAGDDLGTPALVRGCLVEGSLGWGFVSHDSHAVFEDNVAYDVLGSAFVTEIGNELGAFRRNLAVLGKGDDTRHFKEGTGNHDLGFNGHGFWFQGRNVVVEDNVAASQAHAGFFYFHRSYIEDAYVAAPHLRFRAIVEPMRNDAGHVGELHYDRVPIRSFQRNTALGCEVALNVVKAGPDQTHDQRNVFGLVGWRVAQGTNVEYTAFYTFPDLVFVRDPTANGGATAESPQTMWPPEGIHFGNNSNDMTLLDPRVSGWRDDTRLTSPNNDSNPNGWFERTRIDVVAGDLPMVSGHLQVNAVNPTTGVVASTFDPAQHFHRASLDTGAALTFTPAMNQSYVAPTTLDWTDAGSFILTGTKHDSVGDIPVRAKWLGYGIRHRIDTEGCYTQGSGRFLVLEWWFFDRATNDKRLRYPVAVDVTAHCPMARAIRGPLPADLSAPFANKAPVAAADTYTVPGDRETFVAVVGGLLTNDTDGDQQPLRVEVSRLGKATHGVVTVNPNGGFWYLPDPGYLGDDSFTYVASDGTDESAPVTVILHVVTSSTGGDGGTPPGDGGVTPGDGGQTPAAPAGCGCVVGARTHTPGPLAAALTLLLLLALVRAAGAGGSGGRRRRR